MTMTDPIEATLAELKLTDADLITLMHGRPHDAGELAHPFLELTRRSDGKHVRVSLADFDVNVVAMLDPRRHLQAERIAADLASKREKLREADRRRRAAPSTPNEAVTAADVAHNQQIIDAETMNRPRAIRTIR